MKKKIIIIVFIIALIIAIITGIILFLKPNKTETKEPETKKSYVEEKSIEILSASETYEIPVKPYAKDANKNIVSPDGVNFEDTKASFKFYDYKASEVNEEGNVTYSFKYDVEIPIKYTVDTSKVNEKWSRSLALPMAAFFDFYTGDVYREKNVSLDNKATFYNINNLNNNEDMSFTTISWDNKEYKIGVRTEIVSKWDGVQEIGNANGIKTFADTQRATINVLVEAPKDYNGAMIALYKGGTSKERVEFIKQQYNKYIEEHKNDENYVDKTYKILENQYDENAKYGKDEFYVIRLTDVKPE